MTAHARCAICRRVVRPRFLWRVTGRCDRCAGQLVRLYGGRRYAS